MALMPSMLEAREAAALVDRFDMTESGISMAVDWGPNPAGGDSGWIVGLSINDATEAGYFSVSEADAGFCASIEELREFADGCREAAASPGGVAADRFRGGRMPGAYRDGVASVRAIAARHAGLRENAGLARSEAPAAPEAQFAGLRDRLAEMED